MHGMPRACKGTHHKQSHKKTAFDPKAYLYLSPT